MRQDEHQVALDNRVEPMSNSNDRTLSELLLDQRLDFLLSHDVNVCSGLIKHDDLVLAQDGAANADELPLSNAQIRTAFTYLKVNAFALFLPFLSFTCRCSQVM